MTETPETAPAPRRHPILTAARVVVWLIIGLVVAVLTLVGTLFLYFTSLPWEVARIAAASIFVIGVLASFVLLKPRWKALVGFACVWGLLYLWFAMIPARNDREWTPDVAQAVSIEVSGDTLTVHNVRNFTYRAVDDFDEHWETRTYDLGQAQTLDISFTYWSSRTIAHTMLHFGFADGRYLCVSVETRKEVGEVYAPLKSFFKQFELIYVIGDERDLVGLRTHHRKEDTYLFPLAWTPDEIRALLLEILRRGDEIGRDPVYYATIKANCTTALLGHIDTVLDRRRSFSLDLLLNGYMPEYAYRRGQIPTDAPLDEVLARYAVSAKAREAPIDADFSTRIREGLGPTVKRIDEP